MTGVRIDQPETMNLMGLLMKGLIEGNLERPGVAERLARMKGEAYVQAGEMGVTLRFEEGGVVILRGAVGRPRASVRASMLDLLGVVTGAGMIRPVLSRRVRIRGNPLVLLRMLPLIQAPRFTSGGAA
jgi:hypothetical protein